MSFLYVCLFSNGHLKVGRSVNALARISQHEERVSCLGVELRCAVRREADQLRARLVELERYERMAA